MCEIMLRSHSDVRQGVETAELGALGYADGHIAYQILAM